MKLTGFFCQQPQPAADLSPMSPNSTELLDFIEQLKADGLTIVDDPKSVHSVEKAKHYISRIGHYRFKQYSEPFTRILNKNPATIVCGLDDIMKLQKFDRQLRLLSLDALERIEVTMKSYLHDHLVTMYGKDWFLNNNSNIPSSLTNSIEKSLKRHPDMKEKSHSELRHVDTNLLMSAITFGETSRLYNALDEPNQSNIAKRFSTGSAILRSWLWSLTHIRNTAAHHSRLWNITSITPPRIPPVIKQRFGGITPPDFYNERFYGQALVLFYLLQRIARHTKWHYRLFEPCLSG